MGRFVLCPCSPVLEDHYYIYSESLSELGRERRANAVGCAIFDQDRDLAAVSAHAGENLAKNPF